ncbi:hypothetical protein D3C71_1275950 [compost metagenome]
MSKKSKLSGYINHEAMRDAPIIDPVNFEIACSDAMFNATVGISNGPVHIEGTEGIYVIPLPREMMETWTVEEIETYLKENFGHQVGIKP